MCIGFLCRLCMGIGCFVRIVCCKKAKCARVYWMPCADWIVHVYLMSGVDLHVYSMSRTDCACVLCRLCVCDGWFVRMVHVYFDLLCGIAHITCMTFQREGGGPARNTPLRDRS